MKAGWLLWEATNAGLSVGLVRCASNNLLSLQEAICPREVQQFSHHSSCDIRNKWGGEIV